MEDKFSFHILINLPAICILSSSLLSNNARYLSVQNLLSSSSLSKHLKIMIYRTIILSLVLYGCENW